MRRLVVEWSINEAIKQIKDREIEKLKKSGEQDDSKLIKKAEFTELDRLETIKKIKSFEVLHILRFDSSETAAIFRLEPEDNSLKVEELLKSLLQNLNFECQLLEQDRGACIYFIKGKTLQSGSGTASRRGMYPMLPFGVKDGKVRVTLVGDSEQVKALLENRGVNYKVLSLTDAKFSPNSPISRLTEKQQEAISLAFRLGYFDTPRKISADELAQKLGLSSSTLAVHLRRAERRLLAEMLNE
ncbi:MAG: helix-turn-helix domain-containing protein [Candidatus Bathyarchaeia archaeon]